MERNKFVAAFNKAPTDIDKKRMRKLIKRSVDSIHDGEQRGHHNLIVVMEELAELAQQTSKVIRGRYDKESLIEEMADAAISLIYLQEICGVTTLDLYKAMNVKLNRLERVLNEKGEYL